MKRIKVGIIGAGRIAGLLEMDPLRDHPCTHIGGYKMIPQCDVVACCDSDEARAKTFAEKFAVNRVYTDYEELLEKEQLDIVSIAAYAPSRYNMTMAAVASGVRGIFCEKAMAISLEQADRMIAACAKNAIRLVVNHTRRWAHDFQEIRRLINEGYIGELRYMIGTFSGNIIHTGVHMFDCMNMIAGEPQSVRARLYVPRNENTSSSGYRFWQRIIEDKDGLIDIQYRNGLSAHIIGLGQKYFSFELDVHGTKGRIVVGNGYVKYWKRNQSTHYTDFFDLQEAELLLNPSPGTPMLCAVQDCVASVEKGCPSQCDGQEALSAFEIAMAAYVSDTKKGKWVMLPLKNRKQKIVSR